MNTSIKLRLDEFMSSSYNINVHAQQSKEELDFETMEKKVWYNTIDLRSFYFQIDLHVNYLIGNLCILEAKECKIIATSIPCAGSKIESKVV